MRTLITIAIAAALHVTNVRAAANDCPTGQCPLPPFAVPPVSPSNVAPPANNIQVDARPIARIENTTAAGRILGSGTLVDIDGSIGLVVTCAHLFREGVGQVAVSFPDVPAVQGNVLKLDVAADLAAIAIPAPAITPVELAQQHPERGEPVVSCGYGSDGRLFCNRGQVLGYVVIVGGRGRETLELSGAARQGDSGGPVLNQRGFLVGVLFGTNGRVVDATYCGRVRAFLAGLSARFGGRAGEQSPQIDDAQPNHPGPLDKLPPILRRPKQAERDKPANDPSGNDDSSPLDKAAGAAESAARSWLSAKAAALLISLGVPGGIAGLAGGAAVWFVMRRGKRRLQSQLDALRHRRAERSETTPEPDVSLAEPAPSVVERHHNRYVPYEASSVDRAWAVAHARVSERYPGAVPYLKIVEGVKDQLLSGVDEPQLS